MKHKTTKQQRVYEQILEQIHCGVYSGKMPCVAELAESYSVNPLTVRRVLDMLEEEGVVVKKERVGTFVNQKCRIGLLILNEAFRGCHLLKCNSLFDLLIRGASSALEAHSYVLQTAMATMEDRDFLESFKRQVDGVILFRSGDIQESALEFFEDMPRALVLGGFTSASSHTPHITYNNDMIGRVAADYLLQRGCDRLLYYGYTEGSVFGCRWEHFLGHGTGLGKEVLCAPVNPYGTGLSDFFHQSERLLEPILKLPGKTGVFMPSDIACTSFYQIVSRFGISFDRLDIIACDNNSYNLHGLYPKPASIDVRMGDIGRLAAETVLKQIRERVPAEGQHPVLLMPEIVQHQEDTSLAEWLMKN